MRNFTDSKTLKFSLGLIALAAIICAIPLCAPGHAAEYFGYLISAAGFGAVGMAVSNSLPGQRTGITTTPRDCLYSDKGVRYGRAVLDATNGYDGGNTGYPYQLRAGTIMARITATKLWVPCKRTRVNMANATTTALVVDDARAFKVGDTITVGADTAVAITAINYATNTLTIASTAVADNEIVIADSLAGSEIARGILNEFINFRDEDGVDRNKTTGLLLIAGLVDPSQLLGDYAAMRASGVTNYLNFIQFADEAGQT